MNFEEALTLAKQGFSVRRTKWHKSAYIEAQHPDEHSKMNIPYLFIRDDQHNICPWTPQPEDMFVNDWKVVHDKQYLGQNTYLGYTHSGCTIKTILDEEDRITEYFLYRYGNLIDHMEIEPIESLEVHTTDKFIIKV